MDPLRLIEQISFFFSFANHALKDLHVFSKAGMIVPTEICALVTAACCVLTECLQQVVPQVSFVSHEINSFWFTTSQCDINCETACCACQDAIVKYVLPSFHFLLQCTFCLAAVGKDASQAPSLPNEHGQLCTNLNRNNLHFLKAILFLRNKEARGLGSFPSS